MVRFLDIGGIVDHHCLSFLMIIKIIVPMYVAIFQSLHCSLIYIDVNEDLVERVIFGL